MLAEVGYQFVPLAEARNQSLAWVQIKNWQRHFELQAGGLVVAVIQWDGMFKATATVESAEGVWHLARRGFFKVHTDLTEGARQEPTLILKYRWNGGDLTLPGGRELRWGYANFWGTKYAFFDKATNRELITFKYRGFFKSNSDVVIDAEAKSMPSLLMLLALGWYQLLLQMGDSAAAAS